MDGLLGDHRLDVVKIDVEGHEPSVFAGMSRILRESRPLILSEFAPGTIQHISGVAPAAYLDAIAAYGYRFAVMGATGDLEPGASSEEVIAAHARTGRHHIDLIMMPGEAEEETRTRLSGG